jgi:hypothetical protein
LGFGKVEDTGKNVLNILAYVFFWFKNIMELKLNVKQKVSRIAPFDGIIYIQGNVLINLDHGQILTAIAIAIRAT